MINPRYWDLVNLGIFFAPSSWVTPVWDIVKEFQLAGDVVQKFINLKNPVAIAMVLAGIREIMEPSEEEGGNSTGGGSVSGGKGQSVKWSSEKKKEPTLLFHLMEKQ